MPQVVCSKCTARNEDNAMSCRICGTDSTNFLPATRPNDKLERALDGFNKELRTGNRSWQLDNARDGLIVAMSEYLLTTKR